MRIIKFRWWDTVNKTMLTIEAVGAAIASMVGDERYIPLEFTGLKDEAGADVYEGDIVRCKVTEQFDTVIKVGEVKFGNGSFFADFEPHGVQIHLCDLEEYTAIGTIYQNPDRLDDREGL